MNLDFLNTKKVKKALKDSESEIYKIIEEEVEIAAAEIAKEAKMKAPVDKGTLRNSIAHERIDDLNQVVKANATGLAPYAPFVEYGTSRQSAQPFLFPSFIKGFKTFVQSLKEKIK